jgi:hypothetical protein
VLNSQYRVLLEKLNSYSTIKEKFPAFYETQRFIIQAPVKTVMEPEVPLKMGSFLTSYVTISFS